MFRLLVLSVLFLSVVPAFAAKRVTVEQFEQFLATQHKASDSTLADRISNYELTERATTPRLERWETQFTGPLAHIALTGLADSAAFLAPPVEDRPALPPPDRKTQADIVSLSITYVRDTLRKLPNFFATRETVALEDTPGFIPHADTTGTPLIYGGVMARPLHLVNRNSISVHYDGGHEIQEAVKAKSGSDTVLLTTQGEFGPILLMVMGDALHGAIFWQGWEKSPSGLVAVYRYSVAKEKSHYTVLLPGNHKMMSQQPAYHGEITIDPLRGDILRLTLIADMDPDYRPVNTSMLVEYGPVAIGEQTYTCPLRAVAYSRMPSMGDPSVWKASDFSPITRIKDVTFTQYHVFRAGSHIVDTAAIAPADRVETPADENAASADATRAAPTLLTSAEVAAAEPKTAAAAATAPVPETPPAEVAAAEAAPPPAVTTAQGPTAPGAANVLHTHVRLVLVDVTVADHGSPVHNLDRKRVHIFEDGKEQPIASFEEHVPTPAAVVALPALPANTFTNVPRFKANGPLNILLLDGLNTPPQNIADAADQVRNYINHSAQGNVIAIFALGGRLQMVLGFTSDTASLAEAIKTAVADSRRDVTSNPGGTKAATVARDNYNSLAGMAMTAQAQKALANEMQRSEEHDQDAEAQQTVDRVGLTLAALRQLAGYLAAIPGRKNLIWISGSFPVALTPESFASASPHNNPMRNNADFKDAVREMSAAFAAGRVAVYPVDARGVLTMPSMDVSSSPTQSVAELQSHVITSSPDDAVFRTNTSSEHDSMQEAADQTGGQAFFDTNNVKQAVSRAIDSGSSYYTVGYVPPANGDPQYRTIHVQLDESHDTLSYRAGYFPTQPVAPEHSTPAKPATPGKPAPPSAPAAMASALMPGALPSSEILLQARMLPSTDPDVHYTPSPSDSTGALSAKLKGPLRRYVVDLTLDPGTITLSSDQDGSRHVQFDCALVAYDVTGHRVNALDQRIHLDITPAQYEHVHLYGIPLQLAIDLPQQPVTLRLAVYDPATGHTGSLEAQVAAAK